MVFGLDPSSLEVAFKPADKRVDATLGGVSSVSRPTLRESREIVVEESCDSAALDAHAAALAGEILVRALRELHQARIDTANFAASIPELAESLRRARQR